MMEVFHASIFKLYFIVSAAKICWFNHTRGPIWSLLFKITVFKTKLVYTRYVQVLFKEDILSG